MEINDKMLRREPYRPLKPKFEASRPFYTCSVTNFISVYYISVEVPTWQVGERSRHSRGGRRRRRERRLRQEPRQRLKLGGRRRRQEEGVVGSNDVCGGADGRRGVVVGELVVVLLPDGLQEVLSLCQASHQVLT